MKVVDRSPYIAKPGRMTLKDRVEGSVMHGFSWPQEFEAQQVCIDIIGKILGDEFTLFRNISLDNLEISIPLVLVGPPGLFVMFVTPQIGSFRAKESEWLSLESARNAKPVLPNLLVRTSLMAQAIDVHLAKYNVAAPHARPVLVCTNPHMFVECVHSIVDVQLNDTIEYFATNLSKEPAIFTPDYLQKIVDGMVPPEEPEPTSLPEENQVVASEAGQPVPQGVQTGEKQPASITAKKKSGGHKWFRFSRGQWLALGVIIFIEVVALVIIIILTIKSL